MGKQKWLDGEARMVGSVENMYNGWKKVDFAEIAPEIRAFWMHQLITMAVAPKVLYVVASTLPLSKYNYTQTCTPTHADTQNNKIM